MGAAAIINLVGQEGASDGDFLELHRFSDGTVSVRVGHAGEQAQGPRGTTSLIAFAGALAKKSALTIETSEGSYHLQRGKECVLIEFHSHEPALCLRWKGSLADVLGALKDFGSRAA